LNDAGSVAGRARVVAEWLDADERDLLLGWTASVLEIRESSQPRAAKAKAVLAVTFDRDLLLLLGKILVVEARRWAWDGRSIATRSVLLAAAVASLALAGRALGLALIAALVVAPLYLVLGPGFEWIAALHEELVRLAPEPEDE
jgi:hypothetical protein